MRTHVRSSPCIIVRTVKAWESLKFVGTRGTSLSQVKLFGGGGGGEFKVMLSKAEI